jgi:hypothetical protein
METAAQAPRGWELNRGFSRGLNHQTTKARERKRILKIVYWFYSFLNFLGSLRLCVKSPTFRQEELPKNPRFESIFLLTLGSPSTIHNNMVDLGGGLEGNLCMVLKLVLP